MEIIERNTWTTIGERTCEYPDEAVRRAFSHPLPNPRQPVQRREPQHADVFAGLLNFVQFA